MDKSHVVISKQSKEKLEKLTENAVKSGEIVRTQGGIVESLIQAAFNEKRLS